MPLSPTESATGLPARTDDLLRAVADEHRRRVLYHLRDSYDVSSVSDLAAHLRADADVEMADVAARLQHGILPQLEADGLVTFDREHDQVQYVGGSFVTELIDLLRDRERTRR